MPEAGEIPEAHALALDGEGRPAGWTHLGPCCRPLQADSACFRHDLFVFLVAPPARERGAAEAPLAAVAQTLRERGRSLRRWITKDASDRAHAIHEPPEVARDWLRYGLKG